MNASPVSEMRVALTVDDFDASVAFYRDVLGLEIAADWSGEQGRVVVFDAGRATLEIFDQRQAAYVDQIEVGRRVSGPVRFAFEVPDSAQAVASAADRGATVIADSRATPWGDHNARLVDPNGVQLTLFSA